MNDLSQVWMRKIIAGTVIAAAMLGARGTSVQAYTAHVWLDQSPPANAGYYAWVHRTWIAERKNIVAVVYNGSVVGLHCWHDGGQANLNYRTDRWFQVSVPNHAEPITGWLTASAIRKSEQPRLPGCIKVTHRLGDGTQWTDWEAPPQPNNPSSAPTTPGSPATGPGASISAYLGGPYGCSGCYSLNAQVHDFPTGTYTYECRDNSGPGGSDTSFYSHAVAVTSPEQSSWPGVFCYDSPPYVAYLVIDGVVSNSVAFGAVPAPPVTQPPTYPETTGGVSHTWTNYTNAGGYEGPAIPSNATVQIACALEGFRVADGNTWWYRIAQAPWSNNYFVSADAFYNNGQTAGSLRGTPFVDPAVARC